MLTSTVALMACMENEPVDPGAAPDDGPVQTSEPDASMDDEPDAEAPTLGDTLTTIRVGELEFQARVAGPEQGEPVLLLHGFPQTSMEWRAQIEALAVEGYRVVAPDQRGYSPGARPADVGSYRALLLAQDVLGIADALHFERFHLVGHDWGAGVGWIVAVLAPQRLTSLTAISVPHPDAFAKARSDPGSCQAASSSYIQSLLASDAETQLLRAEAAQLRAIYDGLSEELVDAYVAQFTDQAMLTPAVNWYRANFGADSVRVALGPIRVPTLYIWSDEDNSICRDTAELNREYVEAGYRFEVISGVSHWVPEMASEQLNALLLSHLHKPPT